MRRRTLVFGCMAATAAAAFARVHGQERSASVHELLERLRDGGYVLAMRHARAPRAASAGVERRLDAAGRASAAAMGEALRTLRVPIGPVLTSPALRAVETVEQLGFPSARAVDELGDGGHDMRADDEGRRSDWLRERAARPQAGTNVLLVTHLPNLVGAFGDAAADLADGEALVIDPSGGTPTVIGRVPIEAWPGLVDE